MRGSGVLNAVRSLGTFDSERARFSYYTGARSGDSGPLTAAEIDLHFMPAGARFSLAKRVDWREGRAYELAVFSREHALNPTTVVHEFYQAPQSSTPRAAIC